MLGYGTSQLFLAAMTPPPSNNQIRNITQKSESNVPMEAIATPLIITLSKTNPYSAGNELIIRF